MIHFDLFTRCIFTFTKSKNSRQQTKKEKVPMSNNNASEKTNYAVFDRRLLGLFIGALKLVTSFLETPVSNEWTAAVHDTRMQKTKHVPVSKTDVQFTKMPKTSWAE